MSFAEAALVIDAAGAITFQHAPAGRSSVSLPDSRALWEHLWAHRARLAGVAHVHPGSGVQEPSGEDLSTFEAVEQALGRRLAWWIVTGDSVARYEWRVGGSYACTEVWMNTEREPPWARLLRAMGQAGQGSEERTRP